MTDQIECIGGPLDGRTIPDVGGEMTYQKEGGEHIYRYQYPGKYYYKGIKEQ